MPGSAFQDSLALTRSKALIPRGRVERLPRERFGGPEGTPSPREGAHLRLDSLMNRSPPRGVLVSGDTIGDPEHDFVEFYGANWPKLVAALAWSIPPGEDPEDVAQEAMARAYERWSPVNVHERPDAWLFVTGFRLATSLRRRWAVRRRLPREDPGSAPDLFDGLILADLLSTLEPRQRAVLLLRHHYGLSTRETARVLRCPEGTVKSLGARARSALRAALTMEEGADDERR